MQSKASLFIGPISSRPSDGEGTGGLAGCKSRETKLLPFCLSTVAEGRGKEEKGGSEVLGHAVVLLW